MRYVMKDFKAALIVLLKDFLLDTINLRAV